MSKIKYKCHNCGKEIETLLSSNPTPHIMCNKCGSRSDLIINLNTNIKVKEEVKPIIKKPISKPKIEIIKKEEILTEEEIKIKTIKELEAVKEKEILRINKQE